MWFLSRKTSGMIYKHYYISLHLEVCDTCKFTSCLKTLTGFEDLSSLVKVKAVFDDINIEESES